MMSANNGNNENRKGLSSFLTIIKIIAIGLFTVIVLFGALLTYLQLSSFSIEYTSKRFDSYISNVDINDVTQVSGSEIVLDVPMNVVNTEIFKHFNSLDLPDYFSIEAIEIDGLNNIIYINSNVYGFKMPFSCQFNQSLTNNELMIDLDHIELGNKALGVPDNISHWVIGFLFNESLPITIDMNPYLAYDFLELDGMTMDSEGCRVDLRVNEVWLTAQIEAVKAGADEELLTLYNTSNNIVMTSAARYIENSDVLTAGDFESLIVDTFNEQETIFQILLLADDDKIEDLLGQYSDLFNKIDRIKIRDTKATMLSDFLIGYCIEIYDAFEAGYFLEEKLYYNQGMPYGFKELGGVSLQRVVEESELTIPEDIYEKLAFCYDFEQDSLLISYVIDDNTYLILDRENKNLIDADSYESLYGYEDTGEAVLTNSVEIWDQIYANVSEYLGTEDIYIRYMKNDDKYAFVIASPAYSFQNYWVFAFRKYGDSWDFLEKNISNIEDFNQEYGDFNLEVVTDEIDTVTVYDLEDSYYSIILQDLVNKGILPSASDITIDYCSYGNEFIAFRLSNGDEYVYKVNNIYLETVFEKETAIVYWPSLPEIIYIQEKPNNE